MERARAYKLLDMGRPWQSVSTRQPSSSGGDDVSDRPLIQVLFEEDGGPHAAVYEGAELTEGRRLSSSSMR